MNPEDFLPYNGNLKTAISRGDDAAVDQITRWRYDDDISFVLPRPNIKNRICETEITFLDHNGQASDGFCGRSSKLNEDINKSNTLYFHNISVKILMDVYILEDTLPVIKNSRKIMAVPFYHNAFSLVDKKEFDRDYAGIYYGLYTNIFWKLKNTSADMSYNNFVLLSERSMIKEIFNLIDSHQPSNIPATQVIDYTVDNPDELNVIDYTLPV